MTKVINLYGGPGTGKSTNAAIFFSLLKENGYNAELITEYVKQWAWEDRKPVNYDQFYFFGKQARKEYTLFNKVDFIVSDSPLALIGYYTRLYGTEQQAECLAQMLNVYDGMCEEDEVQTVHVFLKRVKPYNPNGRFQTEEEAKKIDKDLKKYLKDIKIFPIEITGDREGIEKLYTKIIGRRENVV